jgi:carbon monoxide dehydrogenase subunit G
MKLVDSYTLPTQPDVIWAALNDPAVLQACLPGCKSLEQIDATHFESTVQVRVGPAAATFRSQVELSELNPPHGYTIVGQGNAGAAGFAKVRARVLLEARDGSTVLNYDADVEIGGKLMSVGARLIQSAARKNLDGFFSAFQEHIERLAAPAADAVPSEASHETVGVTAGGAARAPARVARPVKTRTGVSETRWPTWLVAALTGCAGLVVGFLAGHI